MTKKYILNYFPTGGRAEIARLMFLVAGVEFTDNQISKEDWPSVKTDVTRFPLHQMPTLQVDDRVICQSSAIYRYLANEFKLYGATNDEASIIDQVAATVYDFIEGMVKIYFNPALSLEEKKKHGEEVMAKDTTKKSFEFLHELLKANKNASGFFVGDKVSYADILFFGVLTTVLKHNPGFLDPHPELKTLMEKVGGIESIKKHMETRKYEV